MGKIAEIIKKFLNEFFNATIKDDLDFFNKPKALIALTTTSLLTLNALSDTLKKLLEEKLGRASNKSDLLNILDRTNITDEDVENYIKGNKELQKFLNYISNELNEDICSDITLACSDPNYYQEQIDNLLGKLSSITGGVLENIFLRIAETESDFDEKLDAYVLDKNLKGILNKINGNLPWIFMVYLIIIKIKEFLTQNDYPSKYRGKYLQRLLRIIGAILKNELNAVKTIPSETVETARELEQQTTTIFNSLRSLDSIITASLMASFVYLNNRKKYQEECLDAFSENIGPITCEEEISSAQPESTPIFKPFDLNIDTFSCPIDFDDVEVPHEPFDIKLQNGFETCDLVQGESTPIEIEADFYYDTAVKALIENNSKKKFNILSKKNDMVTTRSILGTLGGTRIYSPIDGVVSKIEKNKIYINDVRDPENTYLEEIIQSIQNLYKKLNDTKFFIKDFYINSWYPVMLKASPLIDEELTAEELGKIFFMTGGVDKRFERAQKEAERNKEDYEKDIKKITGKDNVEEKAENEELGKIKEETDKIDKAFYDNLLKIAETGVNQAEVTLPKENDFILVDYYFDLLSLLISYFEQNEILVPFRDKINEFLIERFFVDGWNRNKLIRKINRLCEDLAEGTFFEEEKNFFKEMTKIYNENNKEIDPVKDYVASLANENNEFTENEKQKITDKIMYLFDFFLEIDQKIDEEYVTETNRYEATEKEANYIENYFGERWKRYNEIPNELNELFEILEDLGQTLTTYSIITIDDEEYRYYSIGMERTCPIPEEEDDDYLNPFSDYEFKDIQYWLKYCAFATLASVANPATGWSTGLPPPIGPTPFPVIYIPIKAFQLNWGFIVIGISITGIYPFPWVLISNLSSEYHVPLVDPLTIIRKSVEKIKKSLTQEIKQFKQITLKGYLDDTKNKINAKADEIDYLTEEKRLHKLKKPRLDRTKKGGRLIYIQKIAEWEEIQLQYSKQIFTLRAEKFALELKWKNVYDAYSGGKLSEEELDAKLNSMKKLEERIDKQFEKIDSLITSIEPALIPLPISTSPETANFAFTIKNPNPINEFGEDLNENINSSVLNPIINRFKLKNEAFMSTNFATETTNSMINWKKYTSLLKASRFAIVQKDPFPKYQNLKLTNIPWISFLYTKWAPSGAKTYGFPGFPPLPVG